MIDADALCNWVGQVRVLLQQFDDLSELTCLAHFIFRKALVRFQ